MRVPDGSPVLQHFGDGQERSFTSKSPNRGMGVGPKARHRESDVHVHIDCGERFARLANGLAKLVPLCLLNQGATAATPAHSRLEMTGVVGPALDNRSSSVCGRASAR
jgi:hypothetical protein